MQYKYSASDEDKDLRIKQMAYLKERIEKFRNVFTIVFLAIIFMMVRMIAIRFPNSVFYYLSFLGEIVFSFFMAKALTVLLEIILTSEWFYSSLRKKISCPLKIHYIDTFNNEETKNNIAPGIVVSFDIKESLQNPMVLAFELPQNRYYVVATIDCNEKKDKLKLTITSEEVVAAIEACDRKCVSSEGYLTLCIMKCLNKDIKDNKIADCQMFDMSLKILEFVYLPLLKDNDNKDSNS